MTVVVDTDEYGARRLEAHLYKVVPVRRVENITAAPSIARDLALIDGRGGALLAVAYFWAIRGIVSVLVGPVLGETTPHLPLYLAAALIVEGVAYMVAVKRPYLYGAVSGLLIGTVGRGRRVGLVRTSGCPSRGPRTCSTPPLS